MLTPSINVFSFDSEVEEGVICDCEKEEKILVLVGKKLRSMTMVKFLEALYIKSHY